jgi:hypothetical protein
MIEHSMHHEEHAVTRRAADDDEALVVMQICCVEGAWVVEASLSGALQVPTGGRAKSTCVLSNKCLPFTWRRAAHGHPGDEAETRGSARFCAR